MAATAILQGCGGEDKQVGLYALPLDDAFARLENADIDAFRRARQCGLLIRFEDEPSGQYGITWKVTSSGQPVARFTVTLAAEEQGTRATITLPPGRSGGEIYDGNQHYTRPALHQPLRPAVQELVDAAMEGRDYDVSRLRGLLTAEQKANDDICSLQRAGLEHGHRFAVDDSPGMTAEESARARDEERRRREREQADFGKPMMRPHGTYPYGGGPY